MTTIEKKGCKLACTVAYIEGKYPLPLIGFLGKFESKKFSQLMTA